VLKAAFADANRAVTSCPLLRAPFQPVSYKLRDNISHISHISHISDWSGWFRLAQADSGLFGLVQACSGWFRLVQAGSGKARPEEGQARPGLRKARQAAAFAG